LGSHIEHDTEERFFDTFSVVFVSECVFSIAFKEEGCLSVGEFFVVDDANNWVFMEGDFFFDEWFGCSFSLEFSVGELFFDECFDFGGVDITDYEDGGEFGSESVVVVVEERLSWCCFYDFHISYGVSIGIFGVVEHFREVCSH